jgi:hypothetical protein
MDNQKSDVAQRMRRILDEREQPPKRWRRLIFALRQRR